MDCCAHEGPDPGDARFEIAPVYERAFSAHGDYRPWRQLILGNIERAYAMVS